jgi:hypothetical protein
MEYVHILDDASCTIFSVNLPNDSRILGPVSSPESIPVGDQPTTCTSHASHNHAAGVAREATLVLIGLEDDNPDQRIMDRNIAVVCLGF